MIRKILRIIINKSLSLFGLKVVNNSWGPRGFNSSFRKLKCLGFIPDLIIDVGAARGEWSFESLEVFPDSNYFLIDPLPENKKKLAEICSKKTFDYWSGALGKSDSYLEINVHEDQSSFYESEYSSGQKISVPVRPLDQLLEEKFSHHRNKILLKIDVQGFEMEVLKGAKKSFGSIEVILIEVSFREIYKGSPLAGEVISFMHEEGYRIYDICTFSQRPSDKELAQSDILFVRNDSSIFGDESWNNSRKIR